MRSRIWLLECSFPTNSGRSDLSQNWERIKSISIFRKFSSEISSRPNEAVQRSGGLTAECLNFPAAGGLGRTGLLATYRCIPLRKDLTIPEFGDRTCCFEHKRVGGMEASCGVLELVRRPSHSLKDLL